MENGMKIDQVRVEGSVLEELLELVVRRVLGVIDGEANAAAHLVNIHIGRSYDNNIITLSIQTLESSR